MVKTIALFVVFLGVIMSSILSFADLANAAIAAYKGRDEAFPSRLQFWIDFFGHKPITEISSDDIEDGVDVLAARKKTYIRTTKAGVTRVESDQPLSGSTINRYVASLGSAFKILKQQRLLPRRFETPMRRISRLPEGAARTVDVTVEDVHRLVAVCRVSRNRKLAALVAMAATTGWRKGNLTALRWKDVDTKAGFADACRTKNGTAHRAVLLPWVVAEIERMRPAQSGPNDLVFGAASIEKAWQTALRRADLPAEWTFHHLRHVAASILAQSGASVPVIMSCLNHKSPAMAMRYSHLNTDTLRASMAGAWGAAQ